MGDSVVVVVGEDESVGETNAFNEWPRIFGTKRTKPRTVSYR